MAADTPERMRAPLDLTESLYKTGSGSVKKTDYLRHSAMVDTLAAMVAEFDAQRRLARASLATLIGRDDAGALAVADIDLPPGTGAGDVTGLVQHALETDPLLGRVQAGLLASKAGVVAARAGHLPKVGLFADLNAIGKFAAVVESDVPFVSDRTMRWGQKPNDTRCRGTDGSGVSA